MDKIEEPKLEEIIEEVEEEVEEEGVGVGFIVLITAIIIFLLAGIAVLAYWYFKVHKAAQPQPQPSSPSPSPSPSPPPSPSPSPSPPPPPPPQPPTKLLIGYNDCNGVYQFNPTLNAYASVVGTKVTVDNNQLSCFDKNTNALKGMRTIVLPSKGSVMVGTEVIWADASSLTQDAINAIQYTQPAPAPAPPPAGWVTLANGCMQNSNGMVLCP